MASTGDRPIRQNWSCREIGPNSTIIAPIPAGFICGGIAAAVAETCIALGLGVRMALPVDFVETTGRYVLEVESASFADEMQRALGPAGHAVPIGVVRAEPAFVTAAGEDVSVKDLTAAWRGTLDW